MRLLIEKHNRWTIELTSSDHPSDVDEPSRRRRSHNRARASSIPKIATLFGGSELKVERYLPNSITPLSDAKPSISRGDCTRPPRKRSFRQRISSISKMMLSPGFRERHDEETYYYNPELPGSEVQELQGNSYPAELEGPSFTSVWELPAELDCDSLPNERNLEGYGQAVHRALEVHRDLHHDRNTTSTRHAPTMPTSSQEHTYGRASSAYTSSSAPTSLDVSPIRGPRRSVSSQHLPLVTNIGNYPHVYRDSSCPSLSPATTLSISPISPLGLNQNQHQGQSISKQPNLMGPFPGSLSHIPASFGRYPSTPVESPSRNTINSFDERHLSPIYPRCSSTAVGFGKSTSPISPSNLVAPSYARGSDTFNSYQRQQPALNTSRLGPPMDVLQSTESLASSASENSISYQSVRFADANLRGQGAWKGWASPQIRPEHNAQDELVDMRAFVRNENGFEEPPPTYSPQAQDHPRMWETTAAHVVRREENSNVEEPIPQTVHTRRGRRHASITSVLPIEPRSCEYCGKLFNGQYQKGNWKRHVKQQHTDTSLSFKCRDPMCPAVYRRDDARRKHEWKKHRMVDSKPEKRRNDRRIYMPGMTNTQ